MYGQGPYNPHGAPPPYFHPSHPQQHYGDYAPAPYPPQAHHAQPYGYMPSYGAHAHGGVCEVCGVVGQTKRVAITYNVGALVVRFHKTQNGELCKRCISDTFWKYSLTTFFLGWWGVISFVVSLVTLPINAFYWLSSLGMSQPTEAEYAHAPGSAHRGMPGWKLAAIVFGAGFGLLFLLVILALAAG